MGVLREYGPDFELVGATLRVKRGSALGDLLTWNGSAWTPAAAALNGDVTGTSSTALVARIQGRSVSAAAPSTNDVLTWNGSAWAPTATQAAAPMSLVDFLTGFATSITLGTASNQTSGVEVMFTRARSCTGVRFYWPGAAGNAARTIRCRVWNVGGSLATVDVGVTTPGVYTAAFGAPVALAALTRYRVTIRETANSEYSNGTLGTAPLPARPFTTQDMIVVAINQFSAGGDVNPTSNGSAVYPVEPILA